MRIVVYTLWLIVLHTAVTAQDAIVSKFDLSAQTLVKPELIGKVGTHYMLIDRTPEAAGFPLLILDSNKQFEKKVFLPPRAINAQGFIIGDQLRLIYLTDHPPFAVSMIQVSGDGQLTDRGEIQPVRLSVAPIVVADKDHQRQLICNFSLRDDSGSGILFNGIILDVAGKTVKTFSYPLAFDQVLHQQPQVMLDSKGNTHIIFTERLSSYHISTSVMVNTIPFYKEELLSETLRLERIKFNRMVASDHPGKQAIQLQGFYYDALSPNKKKGLVTVQIPYERTNKTNARFNPFPDTLREQLRSGLTRLRQKDDVLNSIALNAIATENGQTLLSFWVRDLRENELPKDHAIDKNRELDWRQTASDASAFKASLKKIYERWLNGIDVVAVPPPDYRTSAPVLKTNVNTYNAGIWAPSDLVELKQKDLYMNRNQVPARVSIEPIPPGKMNLVNFQLDNNGDLAEYSIIRSGFFQADMGDRIRMVKYPLLHGNKYSFATSGPVNTERPFLIIQPQGNKEPLLLPAPLVLPRSTILSNPVKSASDTYLWLVKNAGANTSGYSLLESVFE